MPIRSVKKFILLGIILFGIIQLHRGYFYGNIFPSLSTVELYAQARTLPVYGKTDPPCLKSQNIYVCAGYCPWYNTDDNEPVSCSFLPRIPHSDFVRYNIYCTPDPDQCPTYNAWLKDDLPPTLEHIKEIPSHLLSNFTLNNTILVKSDSQDFRTQNSFPTNWTIDLIEKYRVQVRAREPFGSYTNRDIYPALMKYASLAIKDKQCAVIGTENPWIEAALLEYNATSVTTIEYATIHSSVPRLFTITPKDFADKQRTAGAQRQIFDSIWSYSSLEHDGLARYGDPLNPYGDLQTMVKISCILKPGGLLFLGIPLSSEDYLQFNQHRIYGPIRLPLLYRNFHVVELLGRGLEQIRGIVSTQSFVVLQNKVGCKLSE